MGAHSAGVQPREQTRIDAPALTPCDRVDRDREQNVRMIVMPSL